MYRISWAVAVLFTVATLYGVLIVNRDLRISDQVLKDGVAQAAQIDSTSATAVTATHPLPAADRAVNLGVAPVLGVLGSLSKAQNTLGSLGDQLGQLGRVLASADSPLANIIAAARQSTNQANGAVYPAAGIVGLLNRVNGKLQALAPQLDQTTALANDIESRLHILLLLPAL
jgi:methyl-accepting chemotaxis protein